MKRICFISLFLTLFFYLYSQNQKVFDIITFSDYQYSTDPEKSEIIPICVKGDSVLVKMKNPYFSLDSIKYYDWGLIKDKKFAKNVKSILNDTTEYEGWLMLLYYKNKGENEFSFRKKISDERFKKIAPNGFVLTSGFKNNSIGDPLPYFMYTNLSDKTIKYITFYVQYKNAVGDLINCKATHTNTFSYTGIGPVEEGETEEWSWDYDADHYIKNAHTMDIKKIVIEYMDRSKCTLVKDIKYGNLTNYLP